MQRSRPGCTYQGRTRIEEYEGRLETHGTPESMSVPQKLRNSQGSFIPCVLLCNQHRHWFTMRSVLASAQTYDQASNCSDTSISRSRLWTHKSKTSSSQREYPRRSLQNGTRRLVNWENHVRTLILPAAELVLNWGGAPRIAPSSLTESEHSHADPSTNIRQCTAPPNPEDSTQHARLD